MHPLQKPRLEIESQDPTVPFNDAILDAAIWNSVGPEASYAPVNPGLPDEVPDLATWNARGAANLGTETQDLIVPFNDEILDTAIWNPGLGATSNWPQGEATLACPPTNPISEISTCIRSSPVLDSWKGPRQCAIGSAGHGSPHRKHERRSECPISLKSIMVLISSPGEHLDSI